MPVLYTRLERAEFFRAKSCLTQDASKSSSRNFTVLRNSRGASSCRHSLCKLDVTACLADFNETRGFQFPFDFAEKKGLHAALMSTLQYHARAGRLWPLAE